MEVEDIKYDKAGKKHGIHFTLPPLTPNGQRVEVSIWGNSKEDAQSKMDKFLGNEHK